MVDSIINPTYKDYSEKIVLTLLYITNDPVDRHQLQPHLDFGRIFALFTDLDYTVAVDRHHVMKDHSYQHNRFVEMLFLAKKALIMILKNWSGFVLLGSQR